MGQSGLSRETAFRPATEYAFKALAAAAARCWQARESRALLIGLEGGLGAGKTTWVRGMLAGLGHQGRVPSPTYTLLEHYALPGLDVLHLDLYRLGGTTANADASGEVEALGLRDWLARARCWVLVEWPERSPALHERCDLLVRIDLDADPAARRVTLAARQPEGAEFVDALREFSESPSS